MKKTNIIFFGIFLLFFGCSETTIDILNESNTVSLIGEGALLGNGEEGIGAQNLIITNSEDWNALLVKMDSRNEVTNTFSETTIDFFAYRVIAVFDELRPTQGYSIFLDVSTNEQNVVVQVEYRIREEGAAAIITQPFSIIAIPINDLPIVFEVNQ